MDLEIRTISPDELDAFIHANEAAFSSVATEEDLERERAMAEPDRCFAAFEGSDIVGTAAAYTMPMAVPGDELAFGFVTAVGVRPTHRRRGVNTRLMRRQLDDAHARGEAVAGLYASEGGIYGRYGYGIGTFGLSFEVATRRAAFVPGHSWSGTIRLVEPDEATQTILSVNAAGRLRRPGMVRLDERRLRYWLTHEHGEERTRPSLFVLHEGHDGPDGYAVYRFKHDWPRGFSESVLTVRQLEATTPAAYADLWRYVLDIDLAETVDAWNRPVDEPLLYLLEDPKRIRPTMIDNLWVRLVDVSAALAARRYRHDGVLTLEVTDPFCPWNEGCYRLEISEGTAEVTAGSSDAPDLACTVTDIGATYLGGTSFHQLHGAGRVRELRDGALATADTMFAWHPVPWSPYDY